MTITTRCAYVHAPSYPFQVPLGALLPERMENLLPAAKNMGTTHITNGCYRLIRANGTSVTSPERWQRTF